MIVEEIKIMFEDKEKLKIYFMEILYNNCYVV